MTTMPTTGSEPQALAFRETFERTRAEIAKAVVGHQEIVDGVLICLFAGGHCLLEGVPGLGKTLLIRSLSQALHLKFSRIQFTPDLMPADVTGTTIVVETENGRDFQFRKGPIFAQIVLADEINRATPKTQSSMLEAMQERSVTVGGNSHELEKPFFVMATQNPIEQEGTYPLPEAQLDRFLLEIDVAYPDREAERRILLETTGASEHKPAQAMTAETLMSTQRLVRRLPVGEAVVDAILDLVRSARPGEGSDAAITDKLAWGPGPRASQSLTLACRARALVEGRLAPSIDDVVALAIPVLKHRVALTFAARADGETVEGIIGKLVERLG
jgi:MoxR-like ATPase